MRSWMLAGVLAAALAGGLLAPPAVEAASRHGRHSQYAPRHRGSYGGHHYRSYYRPHYRSHYRPYYRSYYRPYYYAPPAYYAPGPYYYGYGDGYGYGPRYCPRPSVGFGFYFGY